MLVQLSKEETESLREASARAEDPALALTAINDERERQKLEPMKPTSEMEARLKRDFQARTAAAALAYGINVTRPYRLDLEAGTIEQADVSQPARAEETPIILKEDPMRAITERLRRAAED